LPEYFVVDYSWPVAGNEDRLGLELHSQPVALEAFSRARRTGQLTASAPFAQYQEAGTTLSLPVFDHTRQGGMEQGFLGTLYLMVNVPRLVEILQTSSDMTGLSLQLVDMGLTATSAAVTQRTLAASGDAPWSAVE